MSSRTVGLGAFALLVSVAWMQLNCASNNLNPGGTGGTGGIKGQATGGIIGSGGQAGAGGRCLDGPTGEGGSECHAPTIVVVDAETGAVICDPTFTVTPGDAGTICDPTGNPTPVLTADGSATCIFRLASLQNVYPPVGVRVSAPGYQSTLFAHLVGCNNPAVDTPVGLMPIGDAGGRARDASLDAGTTCTIDDSVDDCTIRDLHRYVCPASAPIPAQNCSPTGEDDFDGFTTRCCPSVATHSG